MNIGVISDTHGSLAAWQRSLELWGKVDLIIHAGDVLYHGPRNPLPRGFDPPELAHALNQSSIPILCARGNCDSEVDQAVLKWPLQTPYLFLQEEGLRILALHGQGMDRADLIALARQYQANVVISGHTHNPELMDYEGLVHLNPGSPSLSRHRDKLPTIAKMEADRIRIIRIDNGDTISSLAMDRTGRN